MLNLLTTISNEIADKVEKHV